MININCRCIHCKKTWKIAINEHEFERYLPGKQFKNKGVMNLCNETVMPVGEYPELTMDTICEDCVDC